MRGGRVQHHKTAAWLDGYEEGRQSLRPLAVMGLVLGMCAGASFVLAFQAWFR